MTDYFPHEPAKEPPKELSKEIRKRQAAASLRAAGVTRDRVLGLAGKILDGIDRALDGLTADAARPTPSVNVARRQLANTLQSSRACANRACRRVRSCQGEPLHCLHAVMPLLPAEALDGILRRQPARRRKRNRAQAVA